MNTKTLMMASAVFLGTIGFGLTFLPQEIYGFLSPNINQATLLILQILGAVYLGFAMLNWMTKNNLIGGIYSKPLLVGNLVHFLVSSFALIKIVRNNQDHFEVILALTIMYVLFALSFGIVSMTHPSKLKSGEKKIVQ